MQSKQTSLHKNTFDGGLNKDVDRSLLKPNTYFDAQNVSIVSNGTFLVLDDISGTSKLAEIPLGGANSRPEVLAAFNTNYKIVNSIDVPCITIFTQTGVGLLRKFNIWAFDTTTNILYKLFEETATIDYVARDQQKSIQAIKYPENGLDFLYFTDNHNQIRKLRCEIPSNYTEGFLTDFDLSLVKLGALGKIELDSINTGGSLFK